MRRVQRAVLLVAVLLLPPGAVAAWGAKGAHEPDTHLDVAGGWMTLNPDTKAVGPHKIYFNGFLGTGGTLPSSINPNLAAFNSSIRTAPPIPIALLGVWKDCNNDGFVGLGDNGAFEYRSSLLTNRSICPVQHPAAERPWATHNDGDWVIEFMAIGYDDVRSSKDEDPLNLDLRPTRVWADWGLPDAGPPLSCPLLPTEYGTFRSTGGLLRYADCLIAHRGVATFNGAAAAAGMEELGFQDAPKDHPERSASPLNRENPWGDEDDASSVRLFDCARGQDVVVGDPTGQLGLLTDEDGRIVSARVFAPAPALQGGGTAAGTVNETEAGLTDCDRKDQDELIDLNGRRAGSDGDLPYGLEDGADATSPGSRRTRTDHAFTFTEVDREADATSLMLGDRTREHGGLAASSLAGFWVSMMESRRVGADPYLSRDQLGAAPVTHITFYGFVHPDNVTALGLRAPAGESYAQYGAAGCAQGTFECEPAKWWLDPSGRDVIPREPRLGGGGPDPAAPIEWQLTPIGVRVGQFYNLRDVDCFDASTQSLRERDLHWGVLTSTACARP